MKNTKLKPLLFLVDASLIELGFYVGKNVFRFHERRLSSPI